MFQKHKFIFVGILIVMASTEKCWSCFVVKPAQTAAWPYAQ